MFKSRFIPILAMILSIQLTVVRSVAEEKDLSASSHFGELYLEIALHNMEFYFLQFEGELKQGASASEVRMLKQIQSLLRQNRLAKVANPKMELLRLAASYDQGKFTEPNPGQAPRFAVTLPFELDPHFRDPIWINANQAPVTLDKSFGYSHAVQILVHEIGHKTPNEDRAATDRLADKLRRLLLQNTQVIQSGKFSYEIIMVDSTNIPSNTSEAPAHEELVIFQKSSFLAVNIPRSIMFAKTVVAKNQVVRIKFNRQPLISFSNSVQRLRIPVSAVTEIHNLGQQEAIMQGSALGSISSFYEVALDFHQDQINRRISKGSQLEFSYDFKLHSKLESPRELQISGYLLGDQIAKRLSSTHLVLEMPNGGTVFVPKLRTEVIDKDTVFVSYGIRLKKNISQSEVLVTGVSVMLDKHLHQRIQFEAPITWSLVQKRKTPEPKMKQKQASSLTASMDLIESIAKISKGTLIRISGPKDLDLIGAQMAITLEMKNSNSENIQVRIPSLHFTANNENLFKSADGSFYYLNLPIQDILIGNIRSFTRISDQYLKSIQAGDTDFIVTVESLVVNDRALNSLEVDVSKLYKVTLTGTPEFKNEFSVGPKCSAVFH